MRDRWKFHAPTAQQREEMLPFRKAFGKLCEQIETLPASRMRSLALTELEESFMWVERAILLCEAPKDES